MAVVHDLTVSSYAMSVTASKVEFETFVSTFSMQFNEMLALSKDGLVVKLVLEEYVRKMREDSHTFIVRVHEFFE